MWVPHPSVLRVRVFLRCATRYDAITDEGICTLLPSAVIVVGHFLERHRTESFRQNTRRSTFPARFQADRLCRDAGTCAPAAKRAEERYAVESTASAEAEGFSSAARKRNEVPARTVVVGISLQCGG